MAFASEAQRRWFFANLGSAARRANPEGAKKTIRRLRTLTDEMAPFSKQVRLEDESGKPFSYNAQRGESASSVTQKAKRFYDPYVQGKLRVVRRTAISTDLWSVARQKGKRLNWGR